MAASRKEAMYNDSITIQRRFWSKVKPSVTRSYNGSACLEWTGAQIKNGYGSFCVGKGRELAHRYAYDVFCKALSPGDCVLHHCDNPRCVNTAHLFIGTIIDNNNDRKLKRRSRWSVSQEQIRQIKVDYADGTHSCSSLALKYGVSAQTINNVINKYKD